MLTTTLTPRQTAVAAALLLGGVVVGFIASRALARTAARRAAPGDGGLRGLVMDALDNVVLLWLTLAGAHLALESLPLLPRVDRIVRAVSLAVAIASVTLVAARLAATLVRSYAVRIHGSEAPGSIFETITRLTVIAVGLLVVLQSLGVSVTPILTAMGVGGLAVALALQDTLSNLFAGVQILASRKVRTGDFVRLDTGEEGYVIDINWRNTAIRQLPNNVVIVPNARLASAILTNYQRPDPELAVLVQVGVAYSSDLARVEQVTIDVAREVMQEVPGGIPEFEPFIRYHTLGDYRIDFTVILRARHFVDQYMIRHEFVKRLLSGYRREGIQIPFPVQTVRWDEPVHIGSPAGGG